MRFKNGCCINWKNWELINLRMWNQDFSLKIGCSPWQYKSWIFLSEMALFFPTKYFQTVFIITYLREYVLLRTQIGTFILSFGSRASYEHKNVGQSNLGAFLTILRQGLRRSYKKNVERQRKYWCFLLIFLFIEVRDVSTESTAIVNHF